MLLDEHIRNDDDGLPVFVPFHAEVEDGQACLHGDDFPHPLVQLQSVGSLECLFVQEHGGQLAQPQKLRGAQPGEDGMVLDEPRPRVGREKLFLDDAVTPDAAEDSH